MPRGGGRPPGPAKTAEQRIAEGGTAKRNAISHRPVVGRSIVVSPRIQKHELVPRPTNMPPEALELWDESIAWLVEKNVVQVADLPALRRMCVCYAISAQAADVIFEQGAFTRGASGQMVEHPALRIMERNTALFLNLAREYGLTTLARTRIALLDVTGRTLESDLAKSLGSNPRRTNRDTLPAA